MAEFEAKVYRLVIEEHPNADALELARVGDYRSIVRKGQFKTGDLGVYIPEAAVLPEWLIKELGLEGRLAGKQKDRVKAIKLRGILSQGLIYPLELHPDYKNVWRFPTTSGACGQLVELGQDVTEILEIVKWSPPIPVHMAGEVFNTHGKTLKYDIENIKKYPDVFENGEEIVITEKIHGTWCCFGYHPEIEHSIVTSKGLSAQGLAFKMNEANEKNLYIRALHGTSHDAKGTVMDRLREMLSADVSMDTPVYILGEVYGQGVQDLQYGAKTPQFRVFDIYVGERGRGWYLAPDSLAHVCCQLEVDRVPTIYRGPFSKEVVDKYTSGKETVSGQGVNIREGVVITPVEEREHPELGRVKLKSVSEQYLLRKGGTEFN